MPMPYRPNPYQNVSLEAPTVPVVSATFNPPAQSNPQWGFAKAGEDKDTVGQFQAIGQGAMDLRDKYRQHKFNNMLSGANTNFA